MTLDAECIVAALMKLAERRPVDETTLAAVVQVRLQQIRQGQFPGFTWMMGLLDEAVQTARLRVGADLLLLRKTLHTLGGVLADLGAADHRVDEVLLAEYFRHLAAEWPRRWFALPDSRAFATRLSTFDLVQMMLSLPWTLAYCWLEQCRQLLGLRRAVLVAEGAG
jgi:hypothetical protein